MIKAVSFQEYVREILKTARYRPCDDADCVVAALEVLPGCMTQGSSVEEARELLIDAIEVWVLSAIKDGEPVPVVNGCSLAITGTKEEPEVAYG
jgi:predicted RNase H-like HicB family nuclease